MSESNSHASETSVKTTVKNIWDGLSTKQKVVVVGTVVAAGYSIGYVRQMRKEVHHLNAAVAYLLKEQGYFPIRK